MSEKSSKASEFEREAGERRLTLVGEFWEFLKHNKKWWLLPILVLILALGALVLMGSTGVGWAIYTVF